MNQKSQLHKLFYKIALKRLKTQMNQLEKILVLKCFMSVYDKHETHAFASKRRQPPRVREYVKRRRDAANCEPCKNGRNGPCSFYILRANHHSLDISHLCSVIIQARYEVLHCLKSKTRYHLASNTMTSPLTSRCPCVACQLSARSSSAARMPLAGAPWRASASSAQPCATSCS